MFLKKVIAKYKIISDVIDLKPKLKEKKALDQEGKEQDLQPKFEEAALRVSTSSTYAYKYELTATVPVSAAFIRNKKRNNMGEFVHQLHAFISDKIGKWMGQPSIGGHTGRASGGMLSVQAKWYFNDAFFAYSLGLDLTEYSGSADVVDKHKIALRLNQAEKAYKDMFKYKSNAQKKLKLRSPDKEEQNKIWKEEFMPDFVKLLDSYEAKGISFSALNQSEQESQRAIGQE